jgi:indole-3-glycerol phosphate synthase
MDKLVEIMASKRAEIASRIRSVSNREFDQAAGQSNPRPSFCQALSDSNQLSVICEIKRRSPSAGDIATIASATDQADLYVKAQADAISILTDEKYFGGSLRDLSEVTEQFDLSGNRVPCLRKDFMVHPIQILEAVEAGASAILIIVRALNDDEIKTLFDVANRVGLDSLFEVHSEPDIERAIEAGAQMVGVNNRDLTTFRTDLALSEKLIPKIPSDITRISESGIYTGDDAKRVRAVGADAILVGEALMRATSPHSLISAFHRA